MKETIEKINEAKAGSLRLTKLINLQPDPSKKKRERAQINKIRYEKEEVTMEATEIRRIIRDYYKQLYANKMDKFLERYSLPRLNQEEIENMNRSITCTEIETVI